MQIQLLVGKLINRPKALSKILNLELKSLYQFAEKILRI
jgi:hypothetical protein